MKVLARDPSWLARPSPGFNFFHAVPKQSSGSLAVEKEEPTPTPHRTLAVRGSEIFVAVGREIRWADVNTLKDVEDDAFRVLKTPVSREITQLTISPSGEMMAILTDHTCHVAILPPSSRLHCGEYGEVKLRVFQLGPTVHVLEQGALVSALWHPMAPTGEGLVTVTRDAGVRVWELDARNRASFDEPTLAVDLRKLGNGALDCGTSRFGVSKGYSPDSVAMEVAGAAFGGTEGWEGMTLWVAMSEGDVYALCPVLPSRWVGELEGLRGDVLDGDVALWIEEVESQDAIGGVYRRPEFGMARLQGPFYLGREVDGEVTDISVIPPSNELSIGVVCLATNAGKVHIYLDLEGIEPEWLSTPAADEKELILFEMVSVPTTKTSYPKILPSPSRYSFLITTPSTIASISLTPWITLLEKELSSPPTPGSSLRLSTLLSAHTTARKLISSEGITSSTLLSTPALGTIIIATTNSGPLYAELSPSPPSPPAQVSRGTTSIPPPRQSYLPPQTFYTNTTLPSLTQSDTYKSLTRLDNRIRFSPATLSVILDAHRILAGETRLLGLAAAEVFRVCDRCVVELKELVRRGGGIEEGALVLAQDREIKQRVEGVARKSRVLEERVSKLGEKVARVGRQGRGLSKREERFGEEVGMLVRELGVDVSGEGGGDHNQEKGGKDKEGETNKEDENTQPSGKKRGIDGRNVTKSPHKSRGENSFVTRYENAKTMEKTLVELAEKAGKEEKETVMPPLPSPFRKRQVEAVWELLDREAALVEGVGRRLRELREGCL
ncbi:hypothetical protein K470DRAFT_260758 [Piedraia hortae CBS 480.64]|uniref:WD40 repeat-like protein n=1 Tax=Piedraia hortae CBS 480.64 TaxID=1314780 RepID=A0A6A7BQX1_9PEZI|nr:hypothetical protein K470DRAFT_260758 [Piedraia hortae CBS 480.64]